MNGSYQVQDHPHGVAVIGSVPVNDLVALTEMWSKRGLKMMSLSLASVLGATLVVVKDDAAERAWRESIGATEKNPDWLRSGDTGTSSKTIYSVLSGISCLDQYGPSVPHDGDDFGRCYRLLKRFPDWRNRMGEVAAKYPEWAPLVREWDKITVMYEAAIAGEKGKRRGPWPLNQKLNQAMRELVVEGRAMKAKA